MFDRRDPDPDGGTPIARRTVLLTALAAGLLTPFVGTGTAQAAEDSWYPIPEESGSVPWW